MLHLPRCFAALIEGALLCCGVVALVSSWEELSTVFVDVHILGLPTKRTSTSTSVKIKKRWHLASLMNAAGINTLRTRAESVHGDVNRSGVFAKFGPLHLQYVLKYGICTNFNDVRPSDQCQKFMEKINYVTD